MDLGIIDAAAEPATPKTYTLSEMHKLTNIAMPTLIRYKKVCLDRLPHVGEGRKMRFYSPAIAAAIAIRAENIKKRGRKSLPQSPASSES